MKIYTATYEATKPSPQAIDVPLNSDYKISIGLTKDGEVVPLTERDVTLDGQPPDGTLGNMVLFNKATGGETKRENFEVKVGVNGPIVYGTFHYEADTGRIEIKEDIPQLDGGTFRYGGT